MLEIQNLSVSIEGKPILKEFFLKINKGEVHALMGPNGTGKSTLARILAGDPAYTITSGQILFEGKELQDLEVEERARLGLFVGFQYPVEIEGVSNFKFLHMAYNARRKNPVSEEVFSQILEEKMAFLDMDVMYKERHVNSGFSGGEKKRNEILQMAVLEPKLAILDETDSGLDIDALRLVAKGVNALRSQENALLLITHYQRLLDYIKPDFVHVIVGGKLVESGDASLALKLEEKGYDWLAGREN